MSMAYDYTINLDILLPQTTIMQSYVEYPLKYKRNVGLQSVCFDDLSVDALPILEHFNQILDTEIIVQDKITDESIQMSDNQEVQDLFELLSKEFESQFTIESITEIDSVEVGKISIAFNTNLCEITPNEIGSINSRAFAIFKTQNYKTINAVMVL